MGRDYKGLGIACGFALVIAGCSSRGPAIQGQVTIDGQPLAGAQVTFVPLDRAADLGAAIVVTDATGAFTVEPHPGTGETLRAGNYAVSVSRMVDPQGNVPALSDYGQLIAARQLRETIPVRYSLQPGVPPAIAAEIEEGENELKFELLSR